MYWFFFTTMTLCSLTCFVASVWGVSFISSFSKFAVFFVLLFKYTVQYVATWVWLLSYLYFYCIVMVFNCVLWLIFLIQQQFGAVGEMIDSEVLMYLSINIFIFLSNNLICNYKYVKCISILLIIIDKLLDLMIILIQLV